MNPFGVDLTGKQAIYGAQQFYKKDASKKERTCACESGPGCSAKEVGLPGNLFGAHTIKVRWSDGVQDTISSYSLYAYINDAGKEVQQPDDGSAPVEDIAHVVTDSWVKDKKGKGKEKDMEAVLFIPGAQKIAPAPAATEAAAEAEATAAPPRKPAAEKPAAAPRQDREEIVSSPEFIALFESTRAKFKDPSKATCKRGHTISAANAHVGDLRRPPHRYSCDPCLRKVPAAPGFSE